MKTMITILALAAVVLAACETEEHETTVIEAIGPLSLTGHDAPDNCFSFMVEYEIGNRRAAEIYRPENCDIVGQRIDPMEPCYPYGAGSQFVVPGRRATKFVCLSPLNLWSFETL